MTGGGVRKRSVTVAGHRTSVSLEEPFWEALREIAAQRGVSVPGLIEHIDRAREVNLSSAIRVFVLGEARGQCPGSVSCRAPRECP